MCLRMDGERERKTEREKEIIWRDARQGDELWKPAAKDVKPTWATAMILDLP